MKSRLGAVVSPLIIGQHRRSISKAISANPRSTSFNADGRANRVLHIGTLANLQLQESESLKRSLHSSVDNEDEFSELGAPVRWGAGKLLNLVTEKPGPYRSVESRRRAVSVGAIRVRSFDLPIRPLTVPKSVSIRIKNIGNETADAAIRSICMALGSLEGVTRTTEDAVYALYNVKGDLECQSILKKLNDMITDGRRWSAHLLPKDSSPAVVSNNEDSKCKLGSQISSHLAELKRKISIKNIDVEDLEGLHMCILHLEDTPGITND